MRRGSVAAGVWGTEERQQGVVDCGWPRGCEQRQGVSKDVGDSPDGRLCRVVPAHTNRVTWPCITGLHVPHFTNS